MEGRPNKNNSSKMSSDMGSVLIKVSEVKTIKRTRKIITVQ